MEQRQPMLHAGIAPALADRLVEPVVSGRRAEGRHIGLPEAPDALGRELDLAHRHEVEGAQRAGRALRLRIEGADRFERVAEEVEAHRVRQPGGKEVDDAAAHGVFAGIAHGAGAQKAVRFEPRDELVGVDRRCPGAAEKVSAAIRARGGTRWTSALTVVERMRGRASEVARPGEPRQRRHALRRHRRYSARRGRRAGNPRPGKASTSISGAMKPSAFWRVCCRCPSRATWTRTAGPSTARSGRARGRRRRARRSRPERWPGSGSRLS